MAISGETIKEASFKDPETNKYVRIELKIRDIILFKLLESIAGAIRSSR